MILRRERPPFPKVHATAYDGKAMKFYVVRYDRRTGLSQIEPFDGADARTRALARRFEMELDADADKEIVVLSAESRADLEMTHARYFHSVHDMASRGAKRSWLPASVPESARA